MTTAELKLFIDAVLEHFTDPQVLVAWIRDLPIDVRFDFQRRYREAAVGIPYDADELDPRRVADLLRRMGEEDARKCLEIYGGASGLSERTCIEVIDLHRDLTQQAHDLSQAKLANTENKLESTDQARQQAEQARQQAEQARQQAEQARQQAEQARQREQQVREQLEQRLKRRVVEQRTLEIGEFSKRHENIPRTERVKLIWTEHREWFDDLPGNELTSEHAKSIYERLRHGEEQLSKQAVGTI